MLIAIIQIGGLSSLLSIILFLCFLIPGYGILIIIIYIMYCIGKFRRFYIAILIMRIIMIVLIAIISAITIFSSNNPLPIVINIFYIVVIILEYKLFKQVQKPEENRDNLIVQNDALPITF